MGVVAASIGGIEPQLQCCNDSFHSDAVRICQVNYAEQPQRRHRFHATEFDWETRSGLDEVQKLSNSLTFIIGSDVCFMSKVGAEYFPAP